MFSNLVRLVLLQRDYIVESDAGHDKMGQVSVQFDTGSEKWDVNVYKTSMLKLGRHVKNQSQLRPG